METVQNKNEIIDSLVMERSDLITKWDKRKIFYNGVINNINDEVYGCGTASKICSANIDKLYQAKLKDKDGFACLMSYEEGYINVMKAMANILRNGKTFVCTHTHDYAEDIWTIDNCRNIPNAHKFIAGCVHYKNMINARNHSDYTFVFGRNNMGQSYIAFRVLKGISNDKIYR